MRPPRPGCLRCARGLLDAHVCEARRSRHGGNRAGRPVLGVQDRGRCRVASLVTRPPPGRGEEGGQHLGVGDEGRPRSPFDQVPQVLPVAGWPPWPVPRRVRAERDHGQRQPADGGRRDRRVHRAVRRDPSDGNDRRETGRPPFPLNVLTDCKRSRFFS